MNTQNSLIPHPGSLNLVVTRLFTKGEYVHGRLTIDGNFVCHTLENTNSRIPAGEYPITLVKCKHHSRKMPVLKAAIKREESQAGLSFPEREQARPQVNSNCPCDRCPRSLNPNPSSLNLTLPCYCPMIKPGNGVHNRLDGSILVGKFNTWGAIIHPKDAFDPLYERIRKSLSRGNQVTLTVLDG